MPIIYSLVAHEGRVLAESTAPGMAGNFGDVAKMLVKKLPSTNSKLSYIYDAYMFHYVIESSWTFLCICDLKFQRMLAFNMLQDCNNKVKGIAPASSPASASSASSSAATPTSTSNHTLPDAKDVDKEELQKFLEKQMLKYNSLVSEKHQKLYGDLSALKDTMIDNIDKVLSRGERIDLLVDKSDNLNEQSFMFRKNAKKLKQDMWWKNAKMIAGIGGGTLAIIYIIVSSSCGGLTWPEC